MRPPLKECIMAEQPSQCPVDMTLDYLSSRWIVLILRELLQGTKRFGEIRKAVGGISQKMLTASLRLMEEHGVVTRTAYLEIPPRVEYALTALGESLRPVVVAMFDWGVRRKGDQGEEMTEELSALREVLRRKRRVKSPGGEKSVPARRKQAAQKKKGNHPEG